MSRRKRGRSATVSIWKPRIVESDGGKDLIAYQEIEDLVFRHPNGTAVSETTGLSLSLEDFAPSIYYKYTINKQIFIPATTLTEFLIKAENADLRIKQGKGGQVALKGVEKRKRQHTPDEEINEQDEEAIQKEERRAQERMMAEDGTWSPEEQN